MLPIDDDDPNAYVTVTNNYDEPPVPTYSINVTKNVNIADGSLEPSEGDPFKVQVTDGQSVLQMEDHKPYLMVKRYSKWTR